MITKDAVEQLQDGHKKPLQMFAYDKAGKQAGSFVAVPTEEGYTLESAKKFVDENRTKPERRVGTLTALDLPSFSAITNRFKADNSVIFKKAEIRDNMLSASLESVLNFDPAGSDNTVADNGDHTVKYSFPLSDELKTWLGKNKVPFDAKGFAEFLEDNVADLVKANLSAFVTEFGDTDDGPPSFATPSTILQLSRGIEVRVDEKVSNTFRNSDGSFNLIYTSENRDGNGQPLKLPEWFALGIPVFDGGKQYQIPMRLRFRVKDGAVAWWFEMYRKNDVFRAAFDDDVKAATDATGLPVFNGVDA